MVSELLIKPSQKAGKPRSHRKSEVTNPPTLTTAKARSRLVGSSEKAPEGSAWQTTQQPATNEHPSPNKTHSCRFSAKNWGPPGPQLQY